MSIVLVPGHLQRLSARIRAPPQSSCQGPRHGTQSRKNAHSYRPTQRTRSRRLQNPSHANATSVWPKSLPFRPKKYVLSPNRMQISLERFGAGFFGVGRRQEGISQVSHAANCRHDFYKHPAITLTRKLLVSSQTVLAILQHGSAPQMFFTGEPP